MVRDCTIVPSMFPISRSLKHVFCIAFAYYKVLLTCRLAQTNGQRTPPGQTTLSLFSMRKRVSHTCE
jgi:hypothetical protein